MISALVTIISSVILLVIFSFKAEGMLIGILLGQVACIIYLLFSLKIFKKIKLCYIEKKLKKELLNYSLPLIPNSISWWIFNSSDRLIVNFMLGLSSVGILAASHKFSGLYITVSNIFHLSWLESTSEHINDKDFKDYFNKMFNIVIFLFVSISLSIIAVMPFVYNLLVDSKFEFGYNLVPIIMIGSIFNVVLAVETAIYVAKKNTKAIANTASVSAIINIIIHICLINFIGLYASVISTALAYLVLCVFRHHDINRKYICIVFDNKKLLYSVILTIIVLSLYYIKLWYLNILMLILVLIFDIIINGKYIKDIYEIILKRRRKEI